MVWKILPIFVLFLFSLNVSAQETDYQKGFLLYKNEEYKKAIELFQKAIEADPEDKKAKKYLARSQRKWTDFQVKEFFLKAQAAVINKDYIKARHWLDKILELKPKYGAARRLGKEVDKVLGKLAENYYASGLKKADEEDFKGAVADLVKAASCTPKDFKIWNALGITLVSNGEFIEAVKFLEKAHLLGPKAPDVINNLAGTYYYLGDFKQAIKMWQKFLSLESKGFLAEENKKNIIQAKIKILNTQLAEEPENPNLYIELGDLFLLKGHEVGAKEAWEYAAQFPLDATQQKELDSRIIE